MSIPVYMSGTLVTTKAQFTNNAGVAADPDTVTLKYRKGASAVVTVLYPAAPTARDGAGAYHADLDSSGFTGPGLQPWVIEWIGTGAVQVLGDDYWNVEPPAL